MPSDDPQAECAIRGKKPFRNPVIWEDLPDPEVIRIRDKYYMSVSSFAFSPGAPVLKSHNLIDWEYIGRSLEALRSIAASTWGTSLLNMRTIYLAVIVFQMLYGIAPWYSPTGRRIKHAERQKIINDFRRI